MSSTIDRVGWAPLFVPNNDHPGLVGKRWNHLPDYQNNFLCRPKAMTGPVFLCGLLLMPIPAWSDTPVSPSGSEAWFLGSSIWPMFVAVPGLALLYGGLVRTKHVMSIFVQCFSMMALWPALGYSLALTDGTP
jgi:hypothetical protein